MKRTKTILKRREVQQKICGHNRINSSEMKVQLSAYGGIIHVIDAMERSEIAEWEVR